MCEFCGKGEAMFVCLIGTRLCAKCQKEQDRMPFEMTFEEGGK